MGGLKIEGPLYQNAIVVLFWNLEHPRVQTMWPQPWVVLGTAFLSRLLVIVVQNF